MSYKKRCAHVRACFPPFARLPPHTPTKGIKWCVWLPHVAPHIQSRLFKAPSHYRHALRWVPYLLGRHAPNQDVRPRHPRSCVQFMFNCTSQVYYDHRWLCPGQDGYVPAGGISWCLAGLYERSTPRSPLRQRCPRLHTLEHIGIRTTFLDRLHVPRHRFPYWLVNP